MKIEFSYLKDGEIKKCKFTSPEHMKNQDKQRLIKIVVRMMYNYIYDQDIDRQDWLNGYIYDDDACLGEVDYFGNFIEREDK